MRRPYVLCNLLRIYYYANHKVTCYESRQKEYCIHPVDAALSCFEVGAAICAACIQYQLRAVACVRVCIDEYAISRLKHLLYE